MKTKNEILNDGADIDVLKLEVLLDIRELLKKQIPKRKYTKCAIKNKK